MTLTQFVLTRNGLTKARDKISVLNGSFHQIDVMIIDFVHEQVKHLIVLGCGRPF
jgi:hypothetical protein